MHANWIERWCVITRREFKYYKAEWIAKCGDLKPLVVVPMNTIVTSRNVVLELEDCPIKKNFFKSDQKTYNELFQFEMFSTEGDYPYQEDVFHHQAEIIPENRHSVNVRELEGFKLWANHEGERRSHRHSPLKVEKVSWMYRRSLFI